MSGKSDAATTSSNSSGGSGSLEILIAKNENARALDDFPLKYHASLILCQSCKLISILAHGTPRWISKFIRLIIFVIVLLPAFVRFALYYFVFSDRVAIAYKDGPSRTSRHYLDLYGSQPRQANREGKAVVIFLTGGAWIIGYKMWGALLARALVSVMDWGGFYMAYCRMDGLLNCKVPFGILVIIPDYRNFPQTNIIGMIDDVDFAIEWTFQNCHRYGGDPRKIVLVGQSAGAHIGSCILLNKIQDATINGIKGQKDIQLKEATWSIGNLRGFIPVSGPYDLITMRSILHQHGLDKGILDVLFCNDLRRYSPTCTLLDVHKFSVASSRPDDDASFDNCIRDDVCKSLLLQFPPTCIIHGKTDRTVPFNISENFFAALREANVRNVELKLYEKWGHTDPILEAPFSGDHTFHKDVYDLVILWTTKNKSAEDSIHSLKTPTRPKYAAFDPFHPACQKICPSLLVELGRFFNPF